MGTCWHFFVIWSYYKGWIQKDQMIVDIWHWFSVFLSSWIHFHGSLSPKGVGWLWKSRGGGSRNIYEVFTMSWARCAMKAEETFPQLWYTKRSYFRNKTLKALYYGTELFHIPSLSNLLCKFKPFNMSSFSSPTPNTGSLLRQRSLFYFRNLALVTLAQEQRHSQTLE